jgi:hypothetical protein
MTTKQKTQFSLENCSCMEMMSQSKGQLEVGDACAEIMSHFADPQGSGIEFFEMMSQMMTSCCGIQHEDQEIIKKV